VSLYIIPSLTPDREENGMGYHIAINGLGQFRRRTAVMMI
jgi:hypothetical protein